MSHRAARARPFAIALLLAWLAAGPARGQESTVRALIEDGDAAFATLDNESAVRWFERARAESGEPLPFELAARLSRVHTDYSLDLIADGEKERAEEEIRTALGYARTLTELHPERPESWFLLAIANGNLAEFEGGRGKVRIGRAVEEHCLRAIGLDPAYAPAYLVLGVFYREVAEVSWIQRIFANTLFGGLPKGSYERSAEFLAKALELDPTITLAQFEMGRTLYRSGSREEARPFLEAGIAQAPMSTVDVRNAIEARRLLDSMR
jgi:tetratricopeptide (TPR) repeat protein